MNTVRSVRNKHKLPRTAIHAVKINLTQQWKNPSLLMATNHTTPHQHALHRRQVSEGRLQSEKRGVEAKREARGEISAVVHGEYIPLLQSCTCVCVCVCVCVSAHRARPHCCARSTRRIEELQQSIEALAALRRSNSSPTGAPLGGRRTWHGCFHVSIFSFHALVCPPRPLSRPRLPPSPPSPPTPLIVCRPGRAPITLGSCGQNPMSVVGASPSGGRSCFNLFSVLISGSSVLAV